MCRLSCCLAAELHTSSKSLPRIILGHYPEVHEEHYVGLSPKANCCTDDVIITVNGQHSGATGQSQESCTVSESTASDPGLLYCHRYH